MMRVRFFDRSLKCKQSDQKICPRGCLEKKNECFKHPFLIETY